MKSTKTALAITLVLVALSTLFGSHRSLNALRKEALVVFEQGERGDGVGVKSDLMERRSVCANLCTLAGRYLPQDDPALRAVQADLETLFEDPAEPFAQDDLAAAAQTLVDRLAGEELDDRDARDLSGFAASLESLDLTVSRDAYNDRARAFNETLDRFPAGALGALTGVEDLPVYRSHYASDAGSRYRHHGGAHD